MSGEILPTNIGEKFASKTLRKFYGKAVTPEITNQDYEPIAAVGGTDRVHVLSFLNDVTLRSYSPGSDMTEETWMGDTEDDLLLDQKYYFNFEIGDLNKFEAYVNDLDSALIENAAGILQQTIDSYVLGKDTYQKVKAGHRVGSDYVRGSVKISAAGAVEALSAANNTDGVFGTTTGARNSILYHGISFDDGVTWYRISAITDSSTATITDWNGSTYSGGALYEKVARIEAATALTVTSSTVYGYIVSLGSKLTSDYIPVENRWLVVHPDIGADLRQADELIPAVASAYEKVVENGLLGFISGFKVYESPKCAGNNTNGYICLAGHKSFITFAHSFKRSRVVESEDRFAKKYQGLNVWGLKILTERKKSGAYLYAKT